MINVTLKQLRYFEALAKHQHFGRAADACAISQPALSLQVKELENMFGAPLVERGSRKVHLTATGAELLRQGRKILAGVEGLGDLVRASDAPLAGALRLGIIPTIAPYLLPDIVAGLARDYPGVTLELRESVTNALIQDLLEARLDLAIVALPISEPNLRELVLFEEDFVLVRPEGEAGKPVPSPKSLQSMRLLLLEEGHCFRDQALSFCDITQVQARQVMEGSSLSTLVQMVGAGLGVTLIPEIAMNLEQRAGGICVARFADPAPKRSIGVIWRNTNPLSGQFVKLGEIIRQAGLQKRDAAR
ncbi:hydrogen peroxide-inducible genes activator [Yoonia sp.]|uniref:hydrogen peroxide-inducible genes activator n=1 Tax=Yoonia sp. TaxID=2212373 RepID=UPI003A4D55E8